MNPGQSLDLQIFQGRTFSLTLRWATGPYVYKQITNIENTAPVRLTVPSHGMPEGWRFAVAGVRGLTELNARHSPPRVSEYHEATVVDPNTLEVNDQNGLLMGAYQGGGVVQYLTPVDLTAMTAEMVIRDRVGGTELLRLSDSTGELSMDTAKHTVSIRVAPEVTAAIDWTSGVYDLEVSNGTDTYLLTYGEVSVTPEVTTNG